MQKRPILRPTEKNGPIVGLAAIFGVSLIIGLIIGAVWSRFDQKGIREDDYIVMVSLVYSRDADLKGAQDRLSLIQKDDAGKRVIALADAYPRSHPDAQAEARALRQLATAFEKPGAAPPPPAVEARSGSEDGETFSPWTWLGLALVVICILGIGGPVALRLVNATRHGLAGAKVARPKTRDSSSKWRDVPGRNGPAYPRSRDGEDPRSPLADATPNPTATMNPTSRPARPQRAASPARQSTARFPTSRWNGASTTFVSRYRQGIDPFDEVHPILSPLSGELIGACGMNALLKFNESHDSRYYTMSIWAQDYISDEPLRCVGLVSSYCKAHPPVELMRWAQSRVADEIVVANPGLKLSLESSNLRVDINVLALRYGIDVRGPEDSYFSELEVSFQVQVLSGAFPAKSPV